MFTAQDDLFHTPTSKDRNIVETNWWNFQVPEHNIDGQLYIYFRPNGGTTYAAVYIWDDFCKHFSDALYSDIWSYLPLPDGNLDDYKLENGIHVKIRQPLRQYELTYEPGVDTSFHLLFDGLLDPVDYNAHRAPGDRDSLIQNHMEQIGRVTGDLTVRGKRYKVDCVTHRDHSWDSPRREDLHYLPSFTWQAGHFGEDFCFQVWFRYEEPEMTDLITGFIYDKKRPKRIVSARRRTKWDESGIEPREVYLDLTDVEGQTYQITGRVQNMFPWTAFLNWVCYAGLVRWEYNGKVGFGDVQDGRQLDWVIQRKRAQRNGKGR